MSFGGGGSFSGVFCGFSSVLGVLDLPGDSANSASNLISTCKENVDKDFFVDLSPMVHLVIADVFHCSFFLSSDE